MATEIISNINSVLVQGGKRSFVNFSQSTFNPAFYQFGLISGTLFIGDTIYIQYGTTQLNGVVIDMTAGNITINNIPYNVFLPPTFSALATFPPTAQDNNFDVRTVAAFNPVVIEMQRQDYFDNTLQSTFNATYIMIPCGVVYLGEWVVNPGYEVGAIIQVISGSGVAENYEILNILSSGGILYATFNKVWSVFNPFFPAIVNILSRLNFYVILKITDNAVVNPQTRELRFTPDASGMMRCEISGALRSLINLNFTIDSIDPNAIRTEETNLYTPFYFATKDNWIGSAESFITYYDPEDVKFAVAGAFQIGDPNNGYYNKYFANDAGSAFYPESMPQWVTQFENPVHFVNFPFTLSFLGNSDLSPSEDFEIRYKITKANGTFYSGVVSGIIFTDFICLAKLNIFEALSDAYTAGVMNDAKSILFRFGRVESIYFFDCLAPITINVKRPIEQSCNTFYVRWINTLGGWDYWLFEGKIYEGLKVENGNNYESYFDNISDISDFENVTFKNVTPVVQVGSSTLTKNESEGLKILTTSPKIYWYNEELSKWIGVRVEPGTFNIRSTKDDYFNVELTFVKPKYFNQFA
jgi:hypothetical protein